jgi:hypothetical protein
MRVLNSSLTSKNSCFLFEVVDKFLIDKGYEVSISNCPNLHCTQEEKCLNF